MLQHLESGCRPCDFSTRFAEIHKARGVSLVSRESVRSPTGMLAIRAGALLKADVISSPGLQALGSRRHRSQSVALRLLISKKPRGRVCQVLFEGLLQQLLSEGWKCNRKAMCTFQVQQCHSGQRRIAAVGGGEISFGYCCLMSPWADLGKAVHLLTHMIAFGPEPDRLVRRSSTADGDAW